LLHNLVINKKRKLGNVEKENLNKKVIETLVPEGREIDNTVERCLVYIKTAKFLYCV
jgi:hypothetical protein